MVAPLNFRLDNGKTAIIVADKLRIREFVRCVIAAWLTRVTGPWTVAPLAWKEAAEKTKTFLNRSCREDADLQLSERLWLILFRNVFFSTANTPDFDVRPRKNSNLYQFCQPNKRKMQKRNIRTIAK